MDEGASADKGANKQKQRSRCKTTHKLREKLRRQTIKGKIEELQEAIPYDKKDKASTIDDALKYIKKLESEIDQLTSTIATRFPNLCHCQCSPMTSQIPNDYNLPPLGQEMGMGMNYPDNPSDPSGACLLDSSSTTPAAMLDGIDCNASQPFQSTNQVSSPSTTPAAMLDGIDYNASQPFQSTNQDFLESGDSCYPEWFLEWGDLGYRE